MPRPLPRTMRRLRVADALPLAVLLLALAASPGLAGAATTAAAKAPAAPVAPPNVTAEMAKGGCKAFADLIAASPDASSTYQSAVEGGMTVFCPSDDAVRAFLPKYKNLTADAQASLLLFHAVPVHYSLGGLKSNNGPMNTLATDGAARSYNFTLQNQGDVVTIKTAASARGAPARVKSTALDRDPLAIYVIDAVVEPVELFKPAPAPAPAPTPAPAADAPKAAGKAARRPAPAVADAPGPAAADAAPVDQKKDAKKSAASAGAPCVRWWLAASLAAVVAAASALA
ncbi:Fasciclin-like arabinogalactan protein 1 [Dichanthelium oligosanthes]|uniref:Fasciclin-like arabinogalactan protein 1 n=1 Tax=Dichanthelium oligosanthes TaxID=888268 RepID=A0A1E5UKG3_9POAL|nr:Fasciclin-like arabinogalactan protein 1 [Dichanthelium oligosanthes]